MVAVLLFLCIGFMIAVLYIDLVFDVSALPHRGNPEPLPTAILDPIATYYRYITSNPYPLIVILLTAVACLVAQIFYDLVPRWAGYASLGLMAANILVTVGKVIPTAKRLALGTEAIELRSRMAHTLLPYHLGLLTAVLLLAVIQLAALAA